MAGDDLDLYGSGDGRRVVSGLLRTLGVLLGAAIAACGVGLFMLRCFDYCPEDPSVDKALILLSAALVLVGAAVGVEAISVRTQAEAGASVVVAGLGCLVALAGIVSLALVPSIDERFGGNEMAAFAALAVVVGGAIAVLRRPGRRR